MLIMDTLTHTTIAIGSLALAYYIGYYSKAKTYTESLIVTMLNSLERDGFVVSELDEDGDKQLVPIKEVIAKALNKST